MAVASIIYLVIVAIVVRAAKLPEEPAAQVKSPACIVLGVGALGQAMPCGPAGSGFLAMPSLLDDPSPALRGRRATWACLWCSA